MVRCASILLLAVLAQAQTPTYKYNFDEAKVANYALPDPLTLANGQPVKDVATWTAKRRPELMALFEDQVYGKTPAGHTDIRVTPPLIDLKALKGKAVRKQVTIYFSDRNDGPHMQVLLYLPPGNTRSPSSSASTSAAITPSTPTPASS